MKTFMFWVTVRIRNNEGVSDQRVMKGTPANSEIEARRKILERYWKSNFQVVKLEPYVPCSH